MFEYFPQFKFQALKASVYQHFSFLELNKKPLGLSKEKFFLMLALLLENIFQFSSNGLLVYGTLLVALTDNLDKLALGLTRFLLWNNNGLFESKNIFYEKIPSNFPEA